jgi:hypothetical protein
MRGLFEHHPHPISAFETHAKLKTAVCGCQQKVQFFENRSWQINLPAEGAPEATDE